MRNLETDSNANINISAATLVGSYTANATRGVIVRLLATQVAGSGDYIAYIKITVGGTAYKIIPLTTGTAASGDTSIGFVSQPIPVDNTDVIDVYIDGLAGDTSTPDTRVDFYEKDYLRPTVTGRTLDVSANGEAGLDWANVGNPTTAVALTNTQINSVTGTVGGIAGTITTFDALWIKIQKWLRLGFRKDSAVTTDHATELGEINANTGTGAGTYANATDSQEAIRDNTPAAAPSTADIKTAMEADGGKLDHIWEMTADDAGVRQLTAHALELAPVGGAGSSDLDEILADHDTEDTLGNVLNDLVEEAAGLYRLTTAALAMAPGAGGTLYSYSDTVDDGSGNLLDGVYVQLSSTSNFADIIATTYTNAIGAFTVRSDTAGTHYLRLQLAGYNFSDQTVTLA